MSSFETLYGKASPAKWQREAFIQAVQREVEFVCRAKRLPA